MEPRHSAVLECCATLEELHRGHRLSLALEVEVHRFPEPEASRSSSRSLRGQDAARLGGALEASRDVHGVAGDHRPTGFRIDGRDDLPGVDAHPDLQRHPPSAHELVVHGLQPLSHPERGAEGTDRVVLVRGRDAEHGHHCVADELLDGATLGFDLLAHRREVAGHHLAEMLGVQTLAQLRGARHVGEEHRDEPPFIRTGLGVDREPARRAESGLRGEVGAAARTGACRHDEPVS